MKKKNLFAKIIFLFTVVSLLKENNNNCVFQAAKRRMKSNMKRQARKEQNRNWTTETTVVSQLFEGQLSYMTLCMHCKHRAQNSQSFTVLSLPIPKDTMKCSIQVGEQRTPQRAAEFLLLLLVLQSGGVEPHVVPSVWSGLFVSLL